MALPEDPATAGWYRYGAAPGSRQGATVVAAHVDSKKYGVGPLAGLGSLRKGDPIELVVGRVKYRYSVTQVSIIDKDRLDVAGLFSLTGPERLHIVTCGGEFDTTTRHYNDNVVAVAVRTAP
jgi:LPXTG-site transpeptidase (sortase) family protein